MKYVHGYHSAITLVMPVLSISIALLLLFACSSSNKNTSNRKTNDSVDNAVRKNAIATTEVQQNIAVPANNINAMKQAFNAIPNLVETTNDDTYLYVHSYGIPEHNMMTGITNWQQQVPIPQAYVGDNAWTIPLHPQIATNPVSTIQNFFRGAIAVAVNGIPVFNPLNNRGEDSYAIGELDKWGGHAGRADDYHYHIIPLHLQEITNNGPLAYALDGFAIYGTLEADGSPQEPLDKNHGHFADGTYHYHASLTYPYFIGNMVGVVSTDANNPASHIVPQARAQGIRATTSPLRGAEILDFERKSDSHFILTYTVNSATNSNVYRIDYEWNNNRENIAFRFIKNGEVKAKEQYNANTPPSRDNK